jgi:hypothetical protein
MWYGSAFTARKDLSDIRPNTLALSMYKRTIYPFFLRTMQVEMQVRQAPPVGGVSYIHRAEAQSLSPRFGKDLFKLLDTI